MSQWVNTIMVRGVTVKKTILVLFLTIGVSAVAAQTGSTNLGMCLADSTSGKDRQDLGRLIVIAMAQHPAMSDSITVPQARVEQINKTAAQIFERLMAVDCKTELKDTYKSGGAKAIEAAFGVLGKVAVDEVMNDRGVQTAMDEMIKLIDLKKVAKALADQ